MCVTTCFAATVAENNDANHIETQGLSYREVCTDEMIADEIQVYGLLDEAVLYHNNGQDIKANFIETEGDDNLVAVFRTKVNGKNYETMYFSEDMSMSKEEVLAYVNEEEPELLQQASDIVSYASETEYKNMVWIVEEGSGKEAGLSSSFVFTRNPNQSTSYGSGSIWTVSGQTNFAKENARRLNGLDTTIDVKNGTTQHLLQHAPVGNSDGPHITGSVSGTGSLGVSVDFYINGFSQTDYSNHSSNFARWKYVANVGNTSTLTTEPAIIVANTGSHFLFKVSHIVDINSNAGNRLTDTKSVQYQFVD